MSYTYGNECNRCEFFIVLMRYHRLDFIESPPLLPLPLWLSTFFSPNLLINAQCMHSLNIFNVSFTQGHFHTKFCYVFVNKQLLKELLTLVPYLFTHIPFSAVLRSSFQCSWAHFHNKCNNEVIILIWLHSPDTSGPFECGKCALESQTILKQQTKRERATKQSPKKV